MAQKTRIWLTKFNPNACLFELANIDWVALGFPMTPLVVGAHTAGDDTVAVDFAIPTGCMVSIEGSSVLHYVSDYSGGVITIAPAIDGNVADEAPVSVLYHFDISDYITNQPTLSKKSQFTQNELILDRNVQFELFNYKNKFYKRDAYTTYTTLSTAFFTTYNAQTENSNNMFIRVDVNRNNGGWKMRYAGRIVSDTMADDPVSMTVSIDTENVMNTLKDIRLMDVEGIYDCHRYTSPTRLTQTVSGQYLEIIRKICNDKKGLSLPKTSFTVINKSKTDHVCTLQTSIPHKMIKGEVITVAGIGVDFDIRNVIVTGVTSDTVSYVKKIWAEETKTDDNAGYSAGVSTIGLSGALTVPVGTTDMQCLIDNNAQIYDVTSYYLSGTYKINISPTLASSLGAGGGTNTITFSTPKNVASAAISVANGVTRYRVVFDSPTDYFDQTIYGWGYDIHDAFFSVEIHRQSFVEESPAFDIITDLCKQMNAVLVHDYVQGEPYAYFRSKNNTSTLKATLGKDSFSDSFKLMPQWNSYSPLGVRVESDVEYWDGQSMQAVGHYQVNGSETQRFTDKYTLSILGDGFFVANASDVDLVVGDKISFRDDATKYRIWKITSNNFYVTPKLKRSIRPATPIYLSESEPLSLSFAQEFNVKLKSPFVYVAEYGGEVRRVWTSYGGLRCRPFASWASEPLFNDVQNYTGVCVCPNVPPHGNQFNPLGQAILYSINADEMKFGKSNQYIDDNSVKNLSAASHTWFGIRSGVIKHVDDESLETKIQLGVWGVTEDGIIAPYVNVFRWTVKMVNGQASSSDKSYEDRFGLYRLDKEYSHKRVSSSNADGNTSYEFYGMDVNANVMNPDMDFNILLSGYSRFWVPAANDTWTTGLTLQLGYGVKTLTSLAGVAPQSSALPPHTGGRVAFDSFSNEKKQQIYSFYQSDVKIYKCDYNGSNRSAIIGGGATYPNTTGVSGANTKLSSSATELVDLWWSYDGLLFIATKIYQKVFVYDGVNDKCYEVLGGATGKTAVDGQDFIKSWEYQVINQEEISSDICNWASQLQDEFFNKRRRTAESELTDLQMNYLDYTLLDRFAVSTDVLANDSGNSEWFVFEYTFNLITHDHKITFLESV